MLRIDIALVEALHERGPCRIDDLVAFLPSYTWGEAFASAYRMSREGRVLLSPIGNLSYQLSLVSPAPTQVRIVSESSTDRGFDRKTNTAPNMGELT